MSIRTFQDFSCLCSGTFSWQSYSLITSACSFWRTIDLQFRFSKGCKVAAMQTKRSEQPWDVTWTLPKVTGEVSKGLPTHDVMKQPKNTKITSKQLFSLKQRSEIFEIHWLLLADKTMQSVSHLRTSNSSSLLPFPLVLSQSYRPGAEWMAPRRKAPPEGFVTAFLAWRSFAKWAHAGLSTQPCMPTIWGGLFSSVCFSFSFNKPLGTSG